MGPRAGLDLALMVQFAVIFIVCVVCKVLIGERVIVRSLRPRCLSDLKSCHF
jgi:hypothetical protein